MIEPGEHQFTPPPPPGAGPGAGNPWEQRQQVGYGAGLLASIKLFITSPGAAYALTLERGDFFSPLLFAVIVGWFGAVIGQIWQFAFQGSVAGLLPPDIREQFLLYMATTPLSLAINLILTPVFLAIILFIWSLVHHLSLMLVGALERSESGFEGTFRVNGYAYVVQLAAIVPLLGPLLSIPWYIALLTIGAARLHRTSTGRALTGALLPLVACCVCGGLFMLMIWALAASAFR